MPRFATTWRPSRSALGGVSKISSIVMSQSGEIAGMSMKGPTMTKENIRSVQELLDDLKGIPKPPGRVADAISITLESSDQLTYARLIDLMDLCKLAGYEAINLKPLTKDGGP